MRKKSETRVEGRTKKAEQTSLKTPPRPTNSFTSAAKQSPPSSSSIREGQSSFPVQITSCCAYAAIVPLSALAWSIGKPSGMGGVGAQAHVGEGQVGIVWNGGGGV